ncbi:MAG: nuclear transport factor 2 family protein [Aequorivita sp.]
MTKITIDIDCENIPEKQFIKEINIAFATGNVQFLTDSVTEKIVWNMIGDRKITGIAQFTEILEEMKEETPLELIVDKILICGKDGAASGVINSQSGKSYAFSDFYEFSDEKCDKLKSISSFIIKV